MFRKKNNKKEEVKEENKTKNKTKHKLTQKTKIIIITIFLVLIFIFLTVTQIASKLNTIDKVKAEDYLNIATEYAISLNNSIESNNITCFDKTTKSQVNINDLPSGSYYYIFTTEENVRYKKQDLENYNKLYASEFVTSTSPWQTSPLMGYIKIKKYSTNKYKFYVNISDTKGNTIISENTEYDKLEISNIKTHKVLERPTEKNICLYK